MSRQLTSRLAMTVVAAVPNLVTKLYSILATQVERRDASISLRGGCRLERSGLL